jgi:hypothetical protein
MAVVVVTTLAAKPDRYEDFLAELRSAKAIMEKHGARSVRVLAGTVAGEATGTVVFTEEFDDFAQYGRYTDAVMADPEVIRMMTPSAGNPTASFQVALWVDMPLAGPFGSDLTPEEEIAALGSGG